MVYGKHADRACYFICRQFRQLAASLVRPDKAYMARRDAVFAETDEKIRIERDGADIRVDIHQLDLSFIDR